MANNDPSEWKLIDTDLVTVLGILPTSESHLYLALNEPGAGELKIPLESALANIVENGMFAQCSYRGEVRGGFFIENTSKGEADAAEGGGKWLSLSGRGALALLDDGIVYPDSTGAKTRDFIGMSRAAILITLIDEAQARGALLNLSYDFSALLDSDGQSWSDNNTPALIVGTKMLEIVRSFSKVGIDFNIVPDVGGFVLSAYKLGLGSDKSETVYFRTGLSCEEITSDERGDKINNALLVEYKGGFINVDDAISILARRRREELLDLKMAQTSASATTIGAAEIELKKNPKKGISLKVYDGVGPRVFVDYGLGDYVILDVNGVETRYRIFGVQPNWVNNKFASLILELNSILYENDIQMAQDVAWLMDQMSAANDAGLLAVSYWAAIGGSDNPATSVKCSVQVGTNLYFGGTFDGLGGTVSANIIGYSLVTGQWFALGAGLPTNTSINAICEHDGAIIAAGLGLDIWSWDGSAWTSIGTMSGFDSFIPAESTPFAKMLVSFDGDLYLGGSNINSIDEAIGDPGDPNHGNLAKMSGGVWEWVGTGSSFTWYNCGLVWNGEIFLGGGTQVDEFMYAFIVSYVGTGSSFTGWLTSVAFEVLCIHVANNTLYAGGSFVLNGLWVSNGTPGLTNWTRLTQVNGTIYSIGSFLTDIYMVGSFTAPSNRVIKYSGGTFQSLTTGLDGIGYTITLVEDDVYVGGIFANAGDKSADMVAAYFSNFESLMDYLENSSSDFDMGGAIHSAPAAALTDASEIPFWDAITNALRKITFANIKTTLWAVADLLYVKLTGDQTVAGVKTFSSFPLTPPSAPTTDYQVANKKYVDDNAGGGGVTPVNPSVVGNLVSFADITGGQDDSGVPAAHVLLGTGWPFNFYRLLYTDAVGNVTDDDRLVYDPTSGIFAFGKNDGSNNSNVMFGGNTGNAAAPNSTLSFWRMISYGVTSTGTNLFKGISARGTKAAPTASLANDLLAHFTGAGHKGTGNVEDNTSTGGMVVVANENQSATNRGTRVELYSTPDGATAKVLGFTLEANGNANIQSGKTYNINGIPHTHAGLIIPYNNTANLYRHANPTATTRFNALINGTPTNAANSVVTFDTVTGGNVTSITPNATGQLAQMRMYNTTRGDYALIVSAAGSQFTLDRNVRTLANPWADNDAVTNYQTTIGTGGVAYAELEIVNADLLGKSALYLEMSCRSTTAGELLSIHPYVAYASSKEQNATAHIGGGTPLTYTRTALITLTSNIIGIGWQGTAYTAIILKILGYLP